MDNETHDPVDVQLKQTYDTNSLVEVRCPSYQPTGSSQKV
jgi:hypothetical protein